MNRYTKKKYKKIGITPAAEQELAAVTDNTAQALQEIAAEIDKIPPQHDIDGAGNISFEGITLSWIRDNSTRETILFTMQDAAEMLEV